MRATVTTLASLTVALLLVVAGPAAAHVMLMPGDVEPGDTLDTELLVVHGCGPGGTIPATDDDASPTVSVQLEVPAPIGISAHDVDGWSVSTDEGSADEPTRILWENDDRSGTTEPIYFDVTIDATAFDDEAEYWLPAIQDCADGERMRWTLPGMEERDGQLAGVSFGVTAAPEEPRQGLSPVAIALIAMLIAGLAGAATFLITGRRSA